MGRRAKKLKALEQEYQNKLKSMQRSYDAATTSQYHKLRTLVQSGNAVMDAARSRLTTFARHLDENDAVTIGVLDDLVNRIVGTGIEIEPMAKGRGGKLHEKTNDAIRALLKDFAENSPEATGELPWGEVQRVLCRSWLRDGEIFVHHIEGETAAIRHEHRAPYTLELLESDMVSWDLRPEDTPTLDGRDRTLQTIHGIDFNQWGRPMGYWVYKEHPGETFNTSGVLTNSFNRAVKRIGSANVTHLKFSRRVRQARGVPILHGVIYALDDQRDAYESERIAMRVAAALTGFIQKPIDVASASDLASNTGADRTFEMSPGVIFDGLLPGEQVGTFGHDRPNRNFPDFTKQMMKQIAAGTGTNYSSISKDYDGTYSAQRQGMVESKVSYDRLRNYFVQHFIRNFYARFIRLSVASGVLSVPRVVDRETLLDADFRGPGMPWIDPQKESAAAEIDINNRLKSRTQIIRERGYDPRVVKEQIELELEEDRKRAEELGLNQPQAQETKPGDDEDQEEQTTEAAA